MFSLSASQRARIRSRSPKDDALIARCLADKPVLFSTLLVGNTFVNFAISTLGYWLFRKYLPEFDWLAVPVITVVLLVFGEITPKRLALRFTAEVAPSFSRLLWFWRTVLTPFNFVLRWSSRAFAPALERERRALSDEELVSVMESASESGDFSGADTEMISGVLRLSELCANDEMTPRVDIEGYDIDRDDEWRRNAIEHARHRYLPVFARTPDAIEGIIDTKNGCISDALFVPETLSLDDLLVTFARSGRCMAVVLDEYGGTAGIITQNDILELIVGPSVFQHPADEPRIERKGPNRWEIDGRVSLEEINRTLDLELEAEDADRFSGWLQFHAEMIPRVGHQIVADGCRATVIKRRHRRVTLAILEIISRPEAKTDEEIVADTDEAIERTEEDDE